MRILIFAAVLTLTVATSASATSDATCKTLKSPAARLSCYDAQNKPATSARKQTFGKVQGAITWQYNNFVGTKGDVGADVMLIASPFKETMKKLSGPELGLLSLGLALPDFGKFGIFPGEADGFGNYSIDGVPSGSYDVFVFSSKTIPGPDDYMTNSCQAKFADYFSGVADYKGLIFKIHKVYCTSVTVSDDRTTTISHDFGNTYI